VFEEVATLDHDFEGIPTIPPRKDTTHMAFYCEGCRYRWAVAALALARGACSQKGPYKPVCRRWQRLVR
jgi:hypothetical protein